MDIEGMSKANLIHLVEAYRELVSCAWARSIPHEGTDDAECDWCDYIKDELSGGPGPFDIKTEKGQHPAVERDRAVLSGSPASEIELLLLGGQR